VAVRSSFDEDARRWFLIVTIHFDVNGITRFVEVNVASNAPEACIGREPAVQKQMRPPMFIAWAGQSLPRYRSDSDQQGDVMVLSGLSTER
jgi:hypothetical protein